MKPTAWGQGAKKALICVGIVVVQLTIAAAISLATSQPMSHSFWLAWAVLWVLILLVLIGTWVYGRKAGGPILQDCGPHPRKKLYLLMALFYLLLGVTGGVTGASVPKTFGVGGPVSEISLAVYLLIAATRRLQMREHGIWQYWSLLRWNKIGSYYWASDCTLMVRGNSRLVFLWKGALPVPPELKQAVDELLQKHCFIQQT